MAEEWRSPQGGPEAELFGIRPPGIYTDTINPAWKIVSKNSGVWIPMAIILVILSGVIQIPGELTNFLMEYVFLIEDPLPYVIPMLLLSLPAAGFLHSLYTGVMLCGVKAINGQRVEVNDMFLAIRTFGIATLFTLLFYIVPVIIALVFFGSILLGGGIEPSNEFPSELIVPLILTIVTMFVYYIVVMPTYYYAVAYSFLTGTPLWPSIQIVFQRTIGHSMGFLGLGILLGILFTLSFFLCFLPALWTGSMMFLVYAAHFRYLFPELAAYGMPPESRTHDQNL